MEVTTFLQKLYVLFWSAWQCFKFSSYNRIVSAGDFNTEEKETFMKTFLYQYDFKNLVKNSSKPTTINLFLTNDSTYFQKTKIITNKQVSCYNAKNQLSEKQTFRFWDTIMLHTLKKKLRKIIILKPNIFIDQSV